MNQHRQPWYVALAITCLQIWAMKDPGNAQFANLLIGSIVAYLGGQAVVALQNGNGHGNGNKSGEPKV